MISTETITSKIENIINQINASMAAYNKMEGDLKQHLANHNALLGAKMGLEQVLAESASSLVSEPVLDAVVHAVEDHIVDAEVA